MSISNLCNPDTKYLILGCFMTGWFGAKWYRIAKIDPPKVHPLAAILHGGISGAIGCVIHQLVNTKYKQVEKMGLIEKTLYVFASALFSILSARILVNELNLRYLKLDQINDKKTIPV